VIVLIRPADVSFQCNSARDVCSSVGTPCYEVAQFDAGRRRACNLIASVLASHKLVPPLRGRFTHVPASDSWTASVVAQSGISASTDVLIGPNWLAGIRVAPFVA